MRDCTRQAQFLLAVVVCILGSAVGLIPCGLNTANAQVPSEFNQMSLQGTYAFNFTTGANIAGGVGVCHLDGSGDLRCSEILNAATPAGDDRIVIHLTVEGSYNVHANGIVTFTINIFNTDGSLFAEERHLDGVIMHAEQVGPIKLAKEVVIFQREPTLPDDPVGSLARIVLKRLLD